MLMRHGVQLPPKLADLLDMIERVGKRGITTETLSWVFYPDKSRKDAANCVKANIWRLNDLLVSTDFQIRPETRGGSYRLVKRKVRAIA